jgi:hypothetical protein
LQYVYLEDMRRGLHDRLMLGGGDIVFFPVLHSMWENRSAGGDHIEFSRYS